MPLGWRSSEMLMEMHNYKNDEDGGVWVWDIGYTTRNIFVSENGVCGVIIFAPCSTFM